MIAKRALLQIHRWCGLIAAAFILLQATTGAVLVFRDEIAQAIDPAGMTRHAPSGTAPISKVLSAARGAFPGYTLQRLVFPAGPRATYFAHLVNAGGAVRYASIDPGDGAVLRSGSLWRFPIEATIAIHYRLVGGRLALAVVMLVGLSVLALAGTGLLYWWPKSGRWRRSLAINPHLPGKVVLRHSHRTLGVALAAFACLSAVTGLVMASELLVGPGSIRSTAASAIAITPVGDPNRALELARSQFPKLPIRDVRLPTPGAFNVFFLPSPRNPDAVDSVRIDLPSGRILSVRPAAANASLSSLVFPIHTGEILGTPGRLILLLVALALAGSAVTGPLVWLLGRSKPRTTA